MRTRVDYSHGCATPCLPNGKSKIAVIRNHDGGFNAPLQDIEQEMSGNIHVRALLLSVCMRDKKARVGERGASQVLNEYGRLRLRENWTAVVVRYRQGRPFHPLDEVAETEDVNTLRFPQGPKIDALIGNPGWVGCHADSRRAIDESLKVWLRPRGTRDDRIRQGPQV